MMYRFGHDRGQKAGFRRRLQSMSMGDPGESHGRRAQLLRLPDHDLLGLLVHSSTSVLMMARRCKEAAIGDGGKGRIEQ